MSGLAGLQRTFLDFVGAQATKFTSLTGRGINLGEGSSLGGAVNTTSILALYLQGQISYAVAISRLLTSISTTPGVNSPDVDTFIMGAFGYARNAATYDTGLLTYELPSVATSPVSFPINMIVVSQTGPAYMIVADTTGTLQYANGVYTVPVGAQSITFSVVALAAGTASNVPANSTWILQTGGSVPSPLVTPVITNATSIANAADVENDLAYIQRFQAWMAGGGFGTNEAILAAVLGLGSGTLAVSIGDTLMQNGTQQNGVVSVFVGTLGSSAPMTPALNAMVDQTCQRIKAGGITVNSYSAGTISAATNGTVKSDGTVATATLLANVQAAVASYIDSVGMAPLQYPNQVTQLIVPYSGIVRAIYAVPGVAYISNLTLDGSVNDLSVPYATMPVAGAANFTIAA